MERPPPGERSIRNGRLSFQELFLRWLSPFALRIGVPGDSRARHNLPGDWLQPVPLNEAPIGSLNGLYLEGPEAPADLKSLTRRLDLLSQGGVAVFRFDGRPWQRGEMNEVCRGGGFHLRAYRPSGWFGRRRLLVVLQKQVLGEPGLPGKDLSIVLPYSEGLFEVPRRQVTRWAEFLTHLDWQDRSQIVLVNDALMDNDDFRALEGTRHGGLLDLVHHYRSFGPGECERSGLLHAVGRRVLVDESQGGADPRELLPLLGELLREEQNGERSRIAGVAGYSAPERVFATNADRKRRGPRMRRRLVRLRQNALRLVGGARAPFSPFRLYSSAAVRDLGRLDGDPSIYRRLETSLFLRRSGRRVREIPLDLDESRIESPGLRQTLLFRLRRPLRYLAHSLVWILGAAFFYLAAAFAWAPLIRALLRPLLATALPAQIAGGLLLGLDGGLLLVFALLLAWRGRLAWFRRSDDPPRSLAWLFDVRALSLIGLLLLGLPDFVPSDSLFSLARHVDPGPAAIAGLAGGWLVLFYFLTARPAPRS